MRTLHDPVRRGFTSDNCAGVHPLVMSSLSLADGGHQPSYATDVYTERLTEQLRRELGPRTAVLPVFNGTGANVLALTALADRGAAVVCAESAHLNTSECAAPELHGLKLLPVPTSDGRIDPQVLRDVVLGSGPSRARPGVLSLSQVTELGTCYSLDQLQALVGEARRLGLRVHLDGARLANAAAHLGTGLRELVEGVDVVSFGASKNGGMFGECVIVREPSSTGLERWLQKAVTQLPSKTRFVSAQMLALLEDDLWVRNAGQANRHALALADGLAALPGVRVLHPVEANAVFAEVPHAVWPLLEHEYAHRPWHESPGVVRLMTAYDTVASDVDALLDRLRGVLT